MKSTMEEEFIARIGTASEKGVAVSETDIKQGYVENSNVTFRKNFSNSCTRRTFQACRQMFIIQNSALSQVVKG
jgi:flagellar basal body rod protein FlgG